MSVEQRIKISCDNFDCTASISSGVGLTRARTLTSQAGWVSTVHYEGTTYRPILQDFCPDHRDQAIDWQTWRERERARLAAEAKPAHHQPSEREPGA